MANLREISIKAAAMCSDNGFEMDYKGRDYIGYVYIRYVAGKTIAANAQASPLNDDDLYICVCRDEELNGYVVACNGNEPARLFSTKNKAMAFYYRLLNEVDELKLTTYEEDYTPLEDNEAVYRFITRGALL